MEGINNSRQIEEENRKTQKVARTILLHVPQDLWEELKIFCIKNQRTIGSIIIEELEKKFSYIKK